LGKDNQGIKALSKINKTLLSAALCNCKNITLDIDASEVIANNTLGIKFGSRFGSETSKPYKLLIQTILFYYSN
jgi:hypothetical protein